MRAVLDSRHGSLQSVAVYVSYVHFSECVHVHVLMNVCSV